DVVRELHARATGKALAVRAGQLCPQRLLLGAQLGLPAAAPRALLAAMLLPPGEGVLDPIEGGVDGLDVVPAPHEVEADRSDVPRRHGRPAAGVLVGGARSAEEGLHLLDVVALHETA